MWVLLGKFPIKPSGRSEQLPVVEVCCLLHPGSVPYVTTPANHKCMSCWSSSSVFSFHFMDLCSVLCDRSSDGS